MKFPRLNLNFGNLARRVAALVSQRAGGSSLASLAGAAASGGGAVMSSAIDQSVWVYSCISVLGTKLASIPFRFSRGDRGGEDPIDGGPLVDLFDRPHPELDRFAFWQRITDHLELRGQAIIVPLDDAGRQMRVDAVTPRRLPSALLPLDPARCRGIVQDYRLQGWRITGSAHSDPLSSQIILREEAIWIRRPHPNSFFEALPPLQLAMLAAQSDYAAARFMHGLMENNADTGVIVETDQQLQPEQREAVLQALKERKRKAGTADRPLLLWGGTKIVKPTLSSTDMEFLANRRFNRQEICAVFSVPELLLGFTEDANRATAIAQRVGFVENTILPRLARIESSFSGLVRAIDPRASGWWDWDQLPEMRESRRDRFAAAVNGFAIGIPINYLSRIFNLGLPALVHDNRSFLPFNLQQVLPGTATASKAKKGKKNMMNATFHRAHVGAPSNAYARLAFVLAHQQPDLEARIASAAPAIRRAEDGAARTQRALDKLRSALER